MKLRNEGQRSYIDDPRQVGLLQYLTWAGTDVAFAWAGQFEPDTRSADHELLSLASCNRDHYLFYRTLVEQHVDKQGSILDVGAGSGHRAAMLSRYADSVLGIDSDMLKISAAAALNSAENIKWLHADFISWSECSDDVFDYVFAVEIIEHVPLDRQCSFMASLMKHVAPGGRLLMTTPRDAVIERVHPHIGLWDDVLAGTMVRSVGGELKYFNVKQFKDCGDDPRCDIGDSSHYVVIAEKQE